MAPQSPSLVLPEAKPPGLKDWFVLVMCINNRVRGPGDEKDDPETPENRRKVKGTGKPERLRESLRGWWSRRMNGEDRLVYRVEGKGDEQRLEIIQCRLHY
jgi:hypothetical protein